MEPVIEVKNVSKRYSRRSQQHMAYGLGDFLREVFNIDRGTGLRKDEFLAVDDLSFQLFSGDSIALVGRNGAGKTTLLKMLNGMTKPDAGLIRVRGRVQALINLGAGFSPNLSGIDNIYNSAALAGLSRAETKVIFDEVVAFSELEEFIDSPVQTYSQGMKARLGFSVAVHLRPDILLIDEILGVGDYAFQNKCFTKMQELKRNGITIVLVSHSHNSVVKFCKRAIWLHGGKCMQMGLAKPTVRAYLDFLDKLEAKRLASSPDSASTRTKAAAKNEIYGPVYESDERVDDVACELLVNGEPVDVVPIHSEVVVRFQFRLKDEVEHLCSTLNFFRKDGLLVAAIASLRDDKLRHIRTGSVCAEVRISDLDFVPGHYVIMMPIANGKSYLYRNVVKEFYVAGGGVNFVGIKDITHDYSVQNCVEDYGVRSAAGQGPGPITESGPPRE